MKYYINFRRKGVKEPLTRGEYSMKEYFNREIEYHTKKGMTITKVMVLKDSIACDLEKGE